MTPDPDSSRCELRVCHHRLTALAVVNPRCAPIKGPFVQMPGKGLGLPSETRGRTFTRQARMQPRSAFVRDTKSPLSRRHVPTSATGKALSHAVALPRRH